MQRTVRSRAAATILGLVACAAPVTAVVLRVDTADAQGYQRRGDIAIREGTYGPDRPLWEGLVQPGWAYSAVVNLTISGTATGGSGPTASIGWECGQRSYTRTNLGGSYSVQLIGQWIVTGANANLLLYPNNPTTGNARNCALTVERRPGITVKVTTWGSYTGPDAGVYDARYASHIRWFEPESPSTDPGGPEPTPPPGGGGGGAGNTPPPWGGEAGSTPPPAWTPSPAPTPSPPPWGGAPGSTPPPSWTATPRPSPTPPLSPIEWCDEGYGLPALCEAIEDPDPVCFASPAPEVGPPAPSICPTPTPSPTPSPSPDTCTWRIGANGYWRIEGTTECIATSPFLIPTQNATMRVAVVDSQLVGSGSGTGETRELVRVYQSLSTDGSTWGSESHYVSVSNVTATGTATWATSGLMTYDVGATGGNLAIGAGGRYVRVKVINCPANWSAFSCTSNAGTANFMVELVTTSGALGPTPTPAPTAAPTATPGPGTPPPSPPPGDNTPPEGIPQGPDDPSDPGECLPGEVVGPLSGECKPGGPYVTPAVCASPFPSLNPLDYFAWLGCILGNIPAWIANALQWVANMIFDLFVPGEALGPMLEGFMADTRERAPFGWVDQATDALQTGMSAGAVTVDTSFNLAGFTVHVPLYEAATSLAPYRGVVLAFFLFVVVLAILRSLRGAMGMGGGGGGGDDD